MRKKTRANLKAHTPQPSSISQKRKLIDEDDDELVTVESGDELSGVNRGDTGVESGQKKVKSEVLAVRGLAGRKVILGKPISGKTFFTCGIVKLFEDLGFHSFLVDLPKICYPDLVREFYANLQLVGSDQFVSFVSDVKICLSSMFLGAILKIPPSTVSIHTKRGPKDVEGFSHNDQLKLITGSENVSDTMFPSTTQLLPLAQALFKLSIENVSPRLGTRSNLSSQDIVVVSMIMAGRKFDLAELILKNMLESVEGKSSGGLPYGFLLTRVFEWFGVSFVGEDSVSAKEFLDMKFLTQSNLKLDKDGQLVVVEVSPPTPPAQSVNVVDLGISAQEIQEYMDELRANHKEVMDGQKQLSEKMVELNSQFAFWKDMMFGARTSTASEKCSSGSFAYELCKRMYGSGGSSDVKATFTSEDDATDSPRPRTAMDALKEAAGTDSKYAAAGEEMLARNVIAAELVKKFGLEKDEQDKAGS
nr:PREDICTED: uncharacterized protein LOC108194852 [Daucus carota subsp. sativus]